MSGTINIQSADAGSFQFQFVAESNRGALRSHAMRAHWRVRRQRASGPRSAGNGSQPDLQPLRPRVHPTKVQATHQTGGASGSEPKGLTENGDIPLGSLTEATSEALCSMMGIPSGSRLDPFDSLPVRLATVHHRLLHHWLSTSATKMLSYAPASIINTVRDIWLPLDFSNAASFNVCMAHAAAHLERAQGQRCSTTALEFKLEAVQIISGWIQNKAKALSDDMFAAVLRLLTYERQWGTESDWKVHHLGLLQMLSARGGLEALASNWRLALVLYLTTLMARRTWFNSSNNISGLLVPQSIYTLGLVIADESAATRLRSLWFLSLFQDIEHFSLYSMEIEGSIIEYYTNLKDALLLLLVEMEQDGVNEDRDEGMTQAEFRRLACLVFIAIMYRTSATLTLETSIPIQESCISSSSVLAALDAHLSEYCDTWRWDAEGLYITLFSGFFTIDAGIPDRDYVFGMVHVLRSLASAARRAIESCLLHVLCQRSGPQTEIDSRKSLAYNSVYRMQNTEK